MPRHASVQSLVDHLNPNPNLPDGAPRDLAVLTAEYRDRVLAQVGDSPEVAAGLRKLLEAKDCFVRQAVVEARERADVLPSPPVDLRDHARAEAVNTVLTDRRGAFDAMAAHDQTGGTPTV